MELTGYGCPVLSVEIGIDLETRERHNVYIA